MTVNFVNMEEKTDDSDSDSPIIDNNVIRIQLRKPSQHKWELRTRNLSPNIRFPTIQLFDCEGNLLVETNDENISIKSSDYDQGALKSSQSLREKDFRHVINKNSLKKNNTVSGGKIFTRIYKRPLVDENANTNEKRYIVKDSYYVANIPNRLIPANNTPYLKVHSVESSLSCSSVTSELSSLKSSDNELSDGIDLCNEMQDDMTVKNCDDNDRCYSISSSSSTASLTYNEDDKQSDNDCELKKSKSFIEKRTKHMDDSLQRSKSGVSYRQPRNKISFLNKYLKSLPIKRPEYNLDWRSLRQKTQGRPRPTLMNRDVKNNSKNPNSLCSDQSAADDISNIPSDVAANCELKKRLRMYRRGISEIEPFKVPGAVKRTCSMFEAKPAQCSSSESLDEADLVLNRLRRRILRNKIRERDGGYKGKFSALFVV